MLKSKKELKKEKDNAELRAVTYFRKLFAIEHILKEVEINKTPSVLVVDKIKEVIANRTSNNFQKNRCT